jgi:hypothetical protein
VDARRCSTRADRDLNRGSGRGGCRRGHGGSAEG